MINIFVYGSLMFDSVRDAVIKAHYEKLAGCIEGYRRMRVTGEVYPGLIKSTTGSVNGIVILGVDKIDVKSLDDFEGDYYNREYVDVAVNKVGVIKAETYVFREECKYLLDLREWDVEEFRSKGIHTFMSQYCGFMRQRK